MIKLAMEAEFQRLGHDFPLLVKGENLEMMVEFKSEPVNTEIPFEILESLEKKQSEPFSMLFPVSLSKCRYMNGGFEK